MDVQLSYIDPGTGFVLFSVGGWFLGMLGGVFGFVLIFFKKILHFIQLHKKKFTTLGIIVLGFIFIGAFFMTQKKNSSLSMNHKMIILGMDGLSPVIAEKMMLEGKLPHFSRLKEKGSYSRLQTTNPPQSPVAWAAFSTGKNPGKTAMFDFILRDPKTYSLKLSLSNVEKGKAKQVISEKRFWEDLSEQKIPTTVIGCPLTFPPTEIYGQFLKMLSGMGVPDIRGTEGTFSFYTTEPKTENAAVGGKVFHLKKNRMMKIELEGPKTASFTGKVKPAVLPLTLVQKDEKNLFVLYEDKKVELSVGKWSDWEEGTFKLGFMKEMKGIFRFYLVSIEPEVNLYISPVNFDPRDSYFQISHPKNYSKRLADKIGLFHTQGMPIDTWAVNEGRLPEKALLEQTETVFSERLKILHSELMELKESTQSGGILFFYFGMPDTIQHMFWKEENIVHSWYQKMDHVVGQVLEMFPHDTVMVLSDHGFGYFKRAVHINSWLRENGYLTLKDEAKSGRELLMDIDWSRTKAYALGFGAIYMNQKEREKEGIVSKEEISFLKKEMVQKLEQWKEKDMSIVRKAYLREDIFKGKYSKDAPDIYVGFEMGYRASWQTAMGSVPKELIEDNQKKWVGDHLFDPDLVPGVLFVNKPVMKMHASLYDIAPTILKEAGFNESYISARDFDGSALW